MTVNTYTYPGITTGDYTTKYHQVRNLNAKITIVANANTGNINIACLGSMDGTNWFSLVSDNPSTTTPTVVVKLTSLTFPLYMTPGIKYVSLNPASTTISMTVIEYYEPGTQ